jgi:CRISPR-associated Csx2 family protein
MARVLITFLGAGPFSQKENLREYFTASYELPGYSREEHTFVSNYLRKHLRIDRMIIVGTMKSMWEEFYRVLAKDKEVFNEKVYEKLAGTCWNANHLTQPDETFFSDIETLIPGHIKVILLKYGLNEEELYENMKAFLLMENLLDAKDELHIDITHSFRSLPLMATVFIRYLTELSNKNARIKSIYYGMLEASRDVGYTPIVKIDLIKQVFEWIKAAGEIKRQGNLTSLAGIFRSNGSNFNNLAKAVEELNLVLQLHLNDYVEDRTNKVRGALKKTSFDDDKIRAIQLFIPHLKSYLDELTSQHPDWIKMKLIARRHFNNGTFGLCVLSLWESVISKACLLKNIAVNDYTSYKKISNCIADLNPSNLSQNLVARHKMITRLKLFRDSVAHGNKLKSSDLTNDLNDTIHNVVDFLENENEFKSYITVLK